jgi:hypothetical protein
MADDGIGPRLQALLDSITGRVDSAAIVVPRRNGSLEIAATVGLDEASTAGLAAAIGRPTHPIARAMHETDPTFDVLPTVPGGPALRSHLPLVVVRDGIAMTLGVLALAHDRLIDAAERPIFEGVANSAAAEVDGDGGG